jgi:hypothetical protein
MNLLLLLRMWNFGTIATICAFRGRVELIVVQLLDGKC